MRFGLLTVGDHTACAARDAPEAVNEHYPPGSQRAIDKFADARQVHEQVLHLCVVQLDREVVHAPRGPVLQDGQNVCDLVFGEDVGLDCRLQTCGSIICQWSG